MRFAIRMGFAIRKKSLLSSRVLRDPEQTMTRPKILPEGVPVIVAVLNNDEGLGLMIEEASDPPNGSIAVSTDGTIEYTPDDGYSGTDPFTYEVCDMNGLCDVAEVAISVTSHDNAAPIAVDDERSTIADTPVTIDALMNDSDPDDAFEDLVITSDTASSNSGTVVVNGDSTITYTPPSGFSGTASIEYTNTRYAIPRALVTMRVSPSP